MLARFGDKVKMKIMLPMRPTCLPRSDEASNVKKLKILRWLGPGEGLWGALCSP